MSDVVYLAGNTIRLECSFYDFNGTLVDPTIIKFIIYNYKYEKQTEISFPAIEKMSVGVYQFLYVTPTVEQQIYYEWYAEIEGTPSIKRSSLRTKFI